MAILNLGLVYMIQLGSPIRSDAALVAFDLQPRTSQRRTGKEVGETAVRFVLRCHSSADTSTRNLSPVTRDGLRTVAQCPFDELTQAGLALTLGGNVG